MHVLQGYPIRTHIIISENKKYGFQKGHPSLFISK